MNNSYKPFQIVQLHEGVKRLNKCMVHAKTIQLAPYNSSFLRAIAAPKRLQLL